MVYTYVRSVWRRRGGAVVLRARARARALLCYAHAHNLAARALSASVLQLLQQLQGKK